MLLLKRELLTKSKMRVDHGIINTLLEEAANERMHLMAFIKIAQPSFLESIYFVIPLLKKII